MISVEKAEALIMQHLPSPMHEMRILDKTLGYYLAQPIHAERDHPPFDRITHDGIAVSHPHAKAQKSLPIASYAAAGAPKSQLANPAHCIEVATGAPLPGGCDTVIPYEMLDIQNSIAHVTGAFPAPGNSLHFQGSDAKAGEELLAAGTFIGIAETAILAANGFAHVPVYRKPSIGILATGDELADVAAPIATHQIRRSNDITLNAALTLNGFTDSETAWEPDDKARLTQRLQTWLEEKEVILITGGVSRGTYDYVPQVLESLGVQMRFHHVAQRPGKPLWFGTSCEGKPVFGLPGNPASSLTCLRRYVIPAICAISGGTPRLQTAMLATPAAAHTTLTLFVPVKMKKDNSVHAMTTMGSGDFTSLKGSDGFTQLPPQGKAYGSGAQVAYYPWRMQ